MEKKIKKTDEEKAREKFIEDTVNFVKSEFETRREKRRSLERAWSLNLNFLAGKQYVDVIGDELVEDGKFFYWQRRGVFNHIAPIMETRLAKLSKVTPVLAVNPASDDDKEISNSNLAEKVLKQAFKNCELTKTVNLATQWSEACGTAFYKVVWDPLAGRKIGEAEGKDVFEGDVKILAIPPYEIFPDDLSATDVSALGSIIHARALTSSEVESLYGIKIEGEAVKIFDEYLPVKGEAEINEDGVIVIEYYEKPTKDYPKGRMITVAGNELLYYGTLPYQNGENGKYTYPFIRQSAYKSAGKFFGSSIIERLIPVQRAYNAVKNRKHEFLNRMTSGVMTVEDGAVDTDNLAEEGLSPGKIIVYRQGFNPPKMMECTDIPSEFKDEEEKLMNEFVVIAGVSDVASNSQNARVSSGTALQLLIEQDNERLTVSAEEIRNCYKGIAKQVLRLYRQFLSGVKVIKEIDDYSKTKLFYVDKSVITSDDVTVESENELMFSASQKKEIIFKLYESGLLSDDTGKIRADVKEKVLTMLGYKTLDQSGGLIKLNEEKAKNENLSILKGEVAIEIFDDDLIHVDEHKRFVLSEYENLSKEQKQRFADHISAHLQRINK